MWHMRHLNPNCSKKASSPSLSTPTRCHRPRQRVPLPTNTPPSPLLHRAGGSGTPATTPITTHRRHASFSLLLLCARPFLHCLEPPRFQEPMPLPQLPRPARHAAVDTSHQRKHRRREPNSANRLLSRFSSRARDGCHSLCDSPPPRQPHCD